MGFLDLPPELFQIILNETDERDVIALQGTCKVLYHFITDQLWRNLTITQRELLKPESSCIRVQYKFLLNYQGRYSSRLMPRENYWTVLTSKTGSIRKFYQMILTGELAFVLEKIRHVLVHRPISLKSSSDISPGLLTLKQLETASRSTVELSFFQHLLPRCPNLVRVEVITFNETINQEYTLPLVPAIISAFPYVPKFLNLDLALPAPPFASFEGVRAFALNVLEADCPEDIGDLFPDARLPSSLESFAVSFTRVERRDVDVSFFKHVLQDCHKLNSLSVRYCALSNEGNLEWIPPSVRTLSIDDVGETTDQIILPSKHITSFSTSSEFGSVFKTCPFGNLQSLCLTAVDNDNIDELVEGAEILFRNNPSLGLLRCSDFDYRSFSRIVEMTVGRLITLYYEYFPVDLSHGKHDDDIVFPPDIEVNDHQQEQLGLNNLEPPSLEFLTRVAVHCGPSLQTLFLDVSFQEGKTDNLCTVLKTFYTHCPSLKRLFFLGSSFEYKEWSLRTVTAKETLDEFASHDTSHFWYMADNEKFKQKFMS